MTTTTLNWISFEFAGLWPLIWHFGIGGVALLACLAGWYFSPVHRIDFIWAALVVIVVMTSTAIGVSIGEHRKQAQWDAARASTLVVVKQARTNAVRSVGRKHPRWLPDRRDPDLRD